MHHTKSRASSQDLENEISIPWMEAMGVDETTAPALVLRGSRYKNGMTQKELAEKLNVSQHRISEMEHSKQPIGKETARRLAKIFKTNYRIFL